MDTRQFGIWGKRMVDFICEYLDTIGNQRVIPIVEPGYLRPLLPEKAPEQPEEWPEIFKDIKQLIVPGLTHWQHPRFHAYFPAASSAPSIMGDMLSAAFGCLGFSWAASPAITELEIVMMDWLVDLFGLPAHFSHKSGKGGGVLQSSASDCVLVSMLAARHRAIEIHKHRFIGEDNPEAAVLSHLVAYASTLAHSCVEKASMICFVKFHQIEPDVNHAMTGNALNSAIEEDIKNGLIPFYVCATLGTTSCCSFDQLASVGPVCSRHEVWLHIDAAYAGNSFICPELREYMEGIQHAWSININPNKWLLVGYDCSLMWVRDHQALTSSMMVNPVYLQHKHSSRTVDFRHWGIPLSRRFRALKLWFVIRIYGASGLREYIRNHIAQARLFTQNVLADERFEIFGKPVTGLVCFRLKGSNTINQYLTRAINETLELHVVPAVVNDIYFVRFAVCREDANSTDIEHAWTGIKLVATEILAAKNAVDNWQLYLFNHPEHRIAGISDLDEIELFASPSTSSSWISDSASEDDEQPDRDSILVVGDLEDKLTKLARQRLVRLQERGETAMHASLLEYLNILGWDPSTLTESKTERSVDRTANYTSNGVAEIITAEESVNMNRLPHLLSKMNRSEQKPLIECNSSSVECGESPTHELGENIHISSPIPLDSGNCTWSMSTPKISHKIFTGQHEVPMKSIQLPPFLQHTISECRRLTRNQHDLGTGLINPSTLTKLRRQSLIRMLLNPVVGTLCPLNDLPSPSQRQIWKYAVRRFNDMLSCAQSKHESECISNEITQANASVLHEVIEKNTVLDVFSAASELTQSETENLTTETFVGN
ncbi:hypothetical protein EG68_06462 [Paragonimus skrjabini miyazakii]|uniref:Tyrosine decarboxylase n=1 Tax=Paragonimus skrjabini miyazakii TaxID=59628 RepID=A0A8S9YAG3_9TREM|nr:hypothetical protein EG68_06462 [Paragonimus skrjabini miyazakii]